MKKFMIVLAFLFAFSSPAFSQMSTGQGSDMMGGWGSGWGMGYGWGFGIIVVIAVLLGVIFMMKRK